MTKLLFIPALALVACSSGASKEESVQIFTTTQQALSSGQARAVAAAPAGSAELALDFSGPCTLGGTVAVTGSYSADGQAAQAEFDLLTVFDACRELQGTIDGDVHWASVASGTGFDASLTGDLAWDGSDGSADCTLDVHMAVSAASISYTGSVCGYDVTTELQLGF